MSGRGGIRYGLLVALAGCGAAVEGADFETLAAGEKGCPNGGVEIVSGGEATVVCNGGGTVIRPGSGEDGTVGDSGVDGSPGASGEPGPQGPAGPPGAQIRTDCTWCAPGYAPQCAPDGVTLQRCVDDGDGCGHWEAAEVCDVACAPALRATQQDDLGNNASVEYRCMEEGECSQWRTCPSGQECSDGRCTTISGSDCRKTPCSAGEQCGYDGLCSASDEWFVATATLRTAFDGLTHTFRALDDYLYAFGCSESADYWSTSIEGCTTVVIGSTIWSQSDQGEEYAGPALRNWYLSLSSYRAPGTYDVSCGSLDDIGGNRFTTQNGLCSVTITHFDPGEGGYIQGSFAVAAEVKGHDEPGFDSSLEISGAFRVNAKP